MIKNHVSTNFFGEKWKEVVFDFEHVNANRIEVSNLGRVRSFNKASDGNLLNPSLINGYEIIRLKFFKAKNEASYKKLHTLQQGVFKLAKDIKQLKINKEKKVTIAEAEKLLALSKKIVSKKFLDAAKKRTINYHSLIHRLVATYFLSPPTEQQTLVGHKDYEKLNNKASNLKWMTPEENYAHQQKSPFVIKEKSQRKRVPENTKVAKLSITKVMLLKKLLNQGKPIKQLVKQFKITDTQIFRIKRGENWGSIQAPLS